MFQGVFCCIIFCLVLQHYFFLYMICYMIIYPLLYDSSLYMWLVYYIVLLSFCDDIVWVYGIFYRILLCMRYHFQYHIVYRTCCSYNIYYNASNYAFLFFGVFSFKTWHCLLFDMILYHTPIILSMFVFLIRYFNPHVHQKWCCRVPDQLCAKVM